jgi:hypothetical protein
VAFLNLRAISGIVPRLENGIGGDLDLGAFGGSMRVCVDYITILNDVTNVSSNGHKESEAMLLHAGRVCV